MEFCKVYHEIKAPTNRQYGKPEITGKVVFTPDLQKGEVWTDNGVVVPALPITCHVIDGKMYDKSGDYPSRYVNLMAGGPTANPASMHWRVSYHDMRVGDEHFYIEPFIFKATPYVTVNLADVTPVAGYTPPGIIRGGTGSPGLGIIFKGVVLTQEDLPVDGVENNHAYAITTTKDLAVWQGDEWLLIPNFAGIDVNLEDISDWHYEARKNVEFSRAQLEKMEELRALAEKYAESGYDYMKMSMASADGKSSIFYGSDVPESPKEGDTWFKDTADGSVIIMQYVDGTWVAQVDVDAMDKELADNSARVKDAQDAINTLTTETLPALRAELDNLDTVTALEVADKLATLETKLKNADVALKQELQGELTALDEALSGDLTAKLAGLKGDLEAADKAGAEAVATAFVQLEDRLKAADKVVKDDLVAQLATVRKALVEADEAVTTDLSTKLENARKVLQDASDTIATDLAGVDMLVGNQRPGNLFPDPFFKHPVWGSRYNAAEECLNISANGTTNGVYYFPDGFNVYSHLMTLEPSASYLLTIDMRFGGSDVVKQLIVYSRYLDSSGAWKSAALGRIDRTDDVNYKWGVKSIVLKVPAAAASEVTLGFYVSSTYSSGTIQLRNVRFHRAADDSLIIDGAVTAAKVKAGVIDTDHIAAGAIVATKLAADSVVAGKIAANAVVAESIAAGQVTTKKIAAEAVTANEIASDTILAKNIKAGQITTKKLAADAVTANELAADAVSANKLLAEDATINKLWANGIAAKSVVTNRILVAGNGNMLPEIATYATADSRPEIDPYPSPFTPRPDHPSVWVKGSSGAAIHHPVELVAGQKYRFSYRVSASVDGTSHYWQLRKGNADGYPGYASGSVNVKVGSSTTSYLIANSLANRTITSYEVEFEALTTEIAYLYLYPNHGNGTPNDNGYQWFRDLRLEKMTGSTLIEDGAITTGKVASNAITANEIAADQILAKHVKTDQILAKHVKAGEIKATHLLAEDATIDKLWANGIAAKSITASRLAISPGNMFPDPDFQDPSWDQSVTGGISRNTNGIAIAADGTQNGVYLQPEGKANASMQHTPGVNYLMTANLRFGGTGGITKFSVYARMERDTGVTGATKVGEFVRFPTDGQEHASYRYRDNSTVLDFSSIKMAAGGFFTLGFYVESSMPDGSVAISNVRLTPMSGTTLIENGAITTGKVAANAITANEIATDAVTAKQIKAGEITSDHISSAKISSDKITVKDSFIKNAMIGNGEITDAKIATLNASKITAGYLDANRIKAGDIKTVHIGANQITANEIAAKAVKVDQIDANAVRSNHINTDQILAKHIKTDQILAKHIKAGAIKADHIAADTISAKEIKAEVFTQVGKSVIPLYPGTTRPAWTINANQTATNPTAIKDGDPTWYRFGETASPGSDNMVEVDPDVEYVFSVWIHGTTGAVTYVEAKNQEDSLAVKTGGITGYGSNDKSGTAYLIRNLKLVSGWRKISTKITFTPETRFVKISRIYGNHPNGVTGSVYLADMRLYPNLATQSKVDSIQNKQIQDNKNRVNEIGSLSAELDRRTVGMVPVKADRLARSTTHGVGVAMPTYDRYTNLYLSPSFTGTVVFQVFYVYSLANNKTGHSYQWFFDHTEFTLQPESNLNSYFGPLAEGGKIRHLQFRVPEGKVDQALVLVDHMDWNRG